jgi:glutamate-1-semialdehyde 2,1-aminomutase
VTQPSGTRPATGVSPDRIAALAEVEGARFVADRPQSMALSQRARTTMPRGVPMAWMDELYDHPPVWVSHGDGARFWDVDGNEYLDLYVADMSAFCGHGHPAVVEAVSACIARGNQFLLPSADAVTVAEHLARRYGMPKWQFTLSATQANTEVVRLARAVSGRDVVLVFDGKYHGHVDATLSVVEGGQVVPEYLGLPATASATTRIVAFNDVAAAERALADRQVAVVMSEPAMTNAGFLLPEPGFHDALRRMTRDTGTLLAIDETHTLVTSYAGLAREWDLQPDCLTIGKAIAAGVPLGAYGMSDEVSAVLDSAEKAPAVSGAAAQDVATGGTLFANALSLAAGAAALTQVLTQEAFERTAELGAQLALGLRDVVADSGLPWSVVQHGAHACYFFCPEPPVNGEQSRNADDPELRALARVYLANRGVWESGWWLGPTVSVAHTADDVSQYLATFAAFVDAVSMG